MLQLIEHRLPTISLIAMLIILEFILPRRSRIYHRAFRWISNIGVNIVNVFVVWLLKFIPVFTAAITPFKGILFYINLPKPVEVVISFLILDLLIYFQHKLFHIVPFLWKIHRMHHTDRDLDLTSALRFHPFEILISMIIKIIVVNITGIDFKVLLLFEVYINMFALFNHSCIGIPLGLDRILRLFIITPDMHRVHHSTYFSECNSNYGTILSSWDYIFKTYVKSPKDGHQEMKIGVNNYLGKKFQKLPWMIIIPFL